MLHRLLCFLRLRNPFDYAPPAFSPEPNHQYEMMKSLRPGPDNNRKTDVVVAECCARCGAGKRHAIHQAPFTVDDYRGTSFDGKAAVPPHEFEVNSDGYCVLCGAGKFYPVHTRASSFTEADAPVRHASFPDRMF